ncbi:MAG: J domain-containing protein [Rhodoferax sp.]
MTDLTESLHFSDAPTRLAKELAAARGHVVCGLNGACGRVFFDLLLACNRQGVAVTLVVPGALQDQSAGIAWERLTALGATLHRLRPGAPALQTSVCVIDASSVFSGDLGALKAVPDAAFAGLLLQSDTTVARDCQRGLAQWAAAHAESAVSPDGSATAPAFGADAAISPYEDPLHWAPLWQTELLQAHSLALQAEIADMHRTLNAFDQAQDEAIGPLLRECLDAKRRHLHKLHAQSGSDETRTEAQQAQDQFDRYTQAQNAKPAPAPPLDHEAQAQMKQLYRKLAMRLHPDRVDEEGKAQAQALFQLLQAGYENNDLAALQALALQVSATAQQDAGVASPTAAPPNAAKLRTAALKARLEQDLRDRAALLRSPAWQTLSTQSNWALWFSQQERYLQNELERYQQALEPHTLAASTGPDATP